MKLQVTYDVLFNKGRKIKEFEILLPCSRSFAEAVQGKSTPKKQQQAEKVVERLMDVIEELNGKSVYSNFCTQVVE